MRTHERALLGVACAASILGCSLDNRMLTVRDAEMPEPGSLVIATFEKGTAKPDDPRFNTFQFYAYNTTDAVVTSPLVAPGHNSNFALGLNWKVVDVRSGQADYPGAGVRTIVDASVDLSAYSRIVFGLKYEPTPAGLAFGDTSACYPVTVLAVSVACSEYNTSFRKTVLLPPEWTTATLTFADFAEPSYLPATGTAIVDCLRVADGIDFQAQLNLSDGECAAGSLQLDDITLRLPTGAGDGGTDGDGAAPSTGVPLITDPDGWLAANAAEATGRWWSLGDYYGEDGTPGGGTCPAGGFPMAACSTLAAPTPGMPFRPDANGKMCTSGTAARVANGSDGQPAYSAIYGNMIGLPLNLSDPNPTLSSAGSYDAPAHGITGFAFDIDAVPPGGHLRVCFVTPETVHNPAYWNGVLTEFSPVTAPGHYEMRWPQIGGPMYLGGAAPAFDPTKIQAIEFHTVSNAFDPVPYSFCLSNLMLLTN